MLRLEHKSQRLIGRAAKHVVPHGHIHDYGAHVAVEGLGREDYWLKWIDETQTGRIAVGKLDSRSISNQRQTDNKS